MPVVQVMPAALLGHKNTGTGVMAGAEFGLRQQATDNVWVFGKVSGLATVKDFATKGVQTAGRGAVPFEATTKMQAVGASVGAEWRAAGPFYVGGGVGLKHVWQQTQVKVSSPRGVQQQFVDGRALLGMAHLDLGVEIEPVENVSLRAFVRGEYGRSLNHTPNGPKQDGGVGGGFSAGFRF